MQFADSPRQICPPRAGLSSTMPTRNPHLAADTAAAIPAGPPPVTSTSKCFFTTLFTRNYFHSRGAQNLTASTMMSVVDDDSAFITNSHAAQWAAGLAAD